MDGKDFKPDEPSRTHDKEAEVKFSYIRVAEGVAIVVGLGVLGAGIGIWQRVSVFDVHLDQAIIKSQEKQKEAINAFRLEFEPRIELQALEIYSVKKDLEIATRDLGRLQGECDGFQRWQTTLIHNSERLESLTIRFENLLKDFKEHEDAQGKH